MKVGLLTGTFDPVHVGHVAMARAAMAAAGLDEVWVLVNPAPGHKHGVSGLEARAEMMRLALVGEKSIELGDPSGLNLRTHTMAEFGRLMAAHEDVEFVFIVGAEVFAGMSGWQDAEDSIRKAKFLVAKRPGYGIPELDPRLVVQWFDLEEHARVSSGQIREALAAGHEPKGLHATVLSYIREHHLYGV